MRAPRLPLCFALLTAAAALVPQTASACSGIICQPARLLPAGGPVPPSFTGPTLTVPGYALKPENPMMTRVSVREVAWPNALLLEVVNPQSGSHTLSFDRPLVTGRRYQAELLNGCDQPGSLWEWEVEAASPAPTSLPTLAVVGNGTTSK